ncbi:hypothetical protein [Embleya sp. NBC_00896]|uniref:hypothetical protein n=1 Tax=Embleya sp. NBC_00896 TaxID=2975961 RepID=UPI002F91B93A|nr:hypothetical protein OG928_34490 [Embleya sp. NBC_00896]
MQRIALRLGVAAATVTALAAVTTGSVTAAPSASDRSEVAACDPVGVTRFNHTGYKACNTRTVDVDWNKDGQSDESFVVAPDRTIWHIEAASDGWKEMPHGFRADDMVGAGWTYGQRCVRVLVKTLINENQIWSSCFSDGSWHPWWRVYV